MSRRRSVDRKTWTVEEAQSVHFENDTIRSMGLELLFTFDLTYTLLVALQILRSHSYTKLAVGPQPQLAVSRASRTSIDPSRKLALPDLARTPTVQYSTSPHLRRHPNRTDGDAFPSLAIPNLTSSRAEPFV